MMDDSELQVHFSDASALLAAEDTLKELGYKPYQSGPLELYIPTDRQDTQSAVEIVQSHGGSAVFLSETDGVDQFQDISIPAHIVNEDWQEGYANGNQGGGLQQGLHNRDDDPTFDDSVDGFSGSVKA
ncbi:hypothetical protein [Paenibacillus xylanilyticus]|uniref:hypothetical protein n=1 Tax=Paenibacillus xylanilyticus TaxID=248903 RepID=UPI0039A00EB2